MYKGKTLPTTIILLVALAIASGCSDENARVAQVALEGAERQAEQNQEMTRLNREVALGTKRLVESRADSDQHWQAMQQDIHEQSNQLEAERRQQADARQRDSLLAPVLETLGVLLVCCLPLVLCWRLVTGLLAETEEAAMSQTLIDEMIGPDSALSGLAGTLPNLTGSLPPRLPNDPD
jgi:hypothetical protein